MLCSKCICQLALLLISLLIALPSQYHCYHSLGEVLHWYSHAASTHAKLLKFEELKETGTPHTPVPLVSISDYGAGQQQDKPVALLIFGEHAREVITTETGLWLSKALVGDITELKTWPELQQVLQEAGLDSSPEQVLKEWSKQILERMVVKIFPVENVDGRRKWEDGDLCLRKTPGGVDLNRNYPFAWRRENPSTEMYGGPEPFSEPHSRMIRDIALQKVPRTFINVHSGEWAIYTPWDSKKAIGPGLPEDFSELIQRTASVCRCQAGPAGAVSDYLAFGTSMDWMYTQLGVPYAITLELYGSGGVGMLRPGQKNRPLEDFPFASDPGIAKELPKYGSTTKAVLRTSSRSLNPHGLRGLLQEQVPAPGAIMQLVRSKPNALQRCFSMYNPPEGAEYRDVVARWVVILMLMLKHVSDPAHPKPSLHSLPDSVLSGATQTGRRLHDGGFAAATIVDPSLEVDRRRLLGDAASDASEIAVNSMQDESARNVARHALQDDRVQILAGTLAGRLGQEQDAAAAAMDNISFYDDEMHPVGKETTHMVADIQEERKLLTSNVLPVHRGTHTSPEMKQHSVVVALGLLCLAIVVIPVYVWGILHSSSKFAGKNQAHGRMHI